MDGTPKVDLLLAHVDARAFGVEGPKVGELEISRFVFTLPHKISLFFFHLVESSRRIEAAAQGHGPPKVRVEASLGSSCASPGGSLPQFRDPLSSLARHCFLSVRSPTSTPPKRSCISALVRRFFQIPLADLCFSSAAEAALTG